MPASFTSVALRGEWSISKVLDAFEEKTNAEIHEAIAESAAEAGRLPGGDGNGNAVYVNDSGRGVFGSTRSHRKQS